MPLRLLQVGDIEAILGKLIRHAQLSLNMALPALQQLDEKRTKNEPITPKVRGS